MRSAAYSAGETFDRNDELNLALWGKFLSAGADEELEKLAMEHPVLKQAKAALDRLSADDIARLQAEQREMALLTFEAGMAAARERARGSGTDRASQAAIGAACVQVWSAARERCGATRGRKSGRASSLV